MRTIKPNTRRRSIWLWVLLVPLVLIVGGAVTLAGLIGLGVVDPGRLVFWNRVPRRPANWVAIPVSARPIPAFTKITRDYLVDSKTGQWAEMLVPPDLVPKRAIINRSQLFGRVVGQQKPAYYAFTEEELLPPGSHPGVAGGTPPGKRAYTLDASKLKGIHELAEGDHLDLLASIPIDMPGGNQAAGHVGTSVLGPLDNSLLPKRSVVRPLVQDGVVVTPVHIRNAPLSSSSLMGGASTRTVPVQEVTIAVAPDEVAPLAEALDLKYELTCVARSERGVQRESPGEPRQEKETAPPASKPASGPEAVAKTTTVSAKAVTHDKPDLATTAAAQRAKDLTPGFDPLQPVRSIEMVVGSQIKHVLLTGPGGGPVVADADGAGGSQPSAQVPPANK